MNKAFESSAGNMSFFERIMKQAPYWQFCLVILLSTTFFVALAGYLGTGLVVPALGWGPGAQLTGIDMAAFEARFARWDAGYYYQIATTGYRADGAERAFFPLYPFLAAGLSAVTGLSVLWSGWLISLVCFLAAGSVFAYWIRSEYDQPTATWSLLWFSLFPVAFYYVAFYPESLFLLTTISSVFLARRGQFIASGICIALAGATRPTAYLLAIPYLVEFFIQRNFSWKQLLKFVIGGMIAPLGTIAYMLYLALVVGNPDPIASYSANLAENWKMSSDWPWFTLYSAAAAAIAGEGIGNDWFARATAWQDLLYALFGIVIAIWAFPRLRLSLSLYLTAGVLFFLTSRGPYGHVYESMPRHIAALFPIYIALALGMKQLPTIPRTVLIGISIVLLGIFSAWFASGRWVS
jgi:hypothetical protein